MESRKHSRSADVFEREHVFQWKSHKEDLLFNFFKGFISFKSKHLQFETQSGFLFWSKKLLNSLKKSLVFLVF